MTETQLDRVFEQLDPSEEFASARIRPFRHRIQPGLFGDVLNELMGLVAELHPKPGCSVVGVKEIAMLPHRHSAGVRRDSKRSPGFSAALERIAKFA